MSMDCRPFRVKEGEQVSLRKRPTIVKPFYKSKEHYRQRLEKNVEELSAWQRVQYADNRYSVLLIFQAMDAAGKDGVIRHVLSGINPQGFQVFSFKHPSATELDHDFLWRTTQCFPERGRIGVFNRSYYEEVLIVRVHPEILRGQGIPTKLVHEKTVWQDRFRSIIDLEAHLDRNGTKIAKFFLHISRDEQRRRFIARIEDPEKNWKFAQTDIHERSFWKDYMRAYEECLSATSTKESPWYVVPADDKQNARLIVSEILLDTFSSLNLEYPKTTTSRLRELRALRKQLLEEK